MPDTNKTTDSVDNSLDNNNTPDTEWEKIAEKWLEKESVRVSVLTDLQTLIKEIISSRDTYWKERMRDERRKLLLEDEEAEDTPTPITNEDNLK